VSRVDEGRWSRWGLLASAFALGGALIVASWANYRGAHRATTALHLGQGRLLEASLRDAVHPRHESTDAEALGAMLDDAVSTQESNGLRYVAVLDRKGRILAATGESASLPLVDPREPGGEDRLGLVRAGSRVRMFLSRPNPGPIVPAPRNVSPREARPAGMIIEFDPVIASDVTDQAGRLLIFGLAAAAVMMLVAAVSYGISRRYERAKRRLEHERRLALLGEMSAVLAHEIRNPLASLKGHSQLLAERLPGESPDRRRADRVVLEASRIEALTTDLLDFVRTGPADRRPTAPADVLRAAAEEVDGGGFALDVRQAPEQWLLDGPRLHQALTNLLRNARQASGEGDAPPSARVTTEHGELVMTIRDHGDGLPEGQEDRIFDPFFTTRVSGTGLGLAVARRIVELHGGELTAHNHPEGGAVFRLVFPGDKDEPHGKHPHRG